MRASLRRLPRNQTFFNGPLTASTPSHVGAPQVERSAKRRRQRPGILPAAKAAGTPGVQGDRRGKHRIYSHRWTVRDWHLLWSIERDLSGRMPMRRGERTHLFRVKPKMILQTNLTGNGSR